MGLRCDILWHFLSERVILCLVVGYDICRMLPVMTCQILTGCIKISGDIILFFNDWGNNRYTFAGASAAESEKRERSSGQASRCRVKHEDTT